MPFEGGKAERFPLRLGSERMIPGFEAALRGMRDGDERTFSVTFPDDYGEVSLAGRPVEFTVTMRELRRQELPALDD